MNLTFADLVNDLRAAVMDAYAVQSTVIREGLLCGIGLMVMKIAKRLPEDEAADYINLWRTLS